MSLTALVFAAAVSATPEEIGVEYAYCAAGLSTVVYRIDAVDDPKLGKIRERISSHARAYATLSFEVLGEDGGVAAVRALVDEFMKMDATTLADWLREDGNACRAALPEILRART